VRVRVGVRVRVRVRAWARARVRVKARVRVRVSHATSAPLTPPASSSAPSGESSTVRTWQV